MGSETTHAGTAGVIFDFSESPLSLSRRFFSLDAIRLEVIVEIVHQWILRSGPCPTKYSPSAYFVYRYLA